MYKMLLCLIAVAVILGFALPALAQSPVSSRSTGLTPNESHNYVILYWRTTLTSGSPDVNNSNWYSVDEWNLVAGYHTDSRYKIMRGVFKFDLVNPSIPPNAVVSQAFVKIRQCNPTTTSDMRIDIYNVTRNWHYTTATWGNLNDAFGTQFGSVVVGSILYSNYPVDITPLVQGWVNGTIPNYGIMLRGNENSGATHYKNFCSPYYVSNGPELYVEWSVPANTSTPTRTPTSTRTATPTATDTPSPTPTATPTATDTPSPTPTATPTATETATLTPTATDTPSPTSTKAVLRVYLPLLIR